MCVVKNSSNMILLHVDFWIQRLTKAVIFFHIVVAFVSPVQLLGVSAPLPSNMQAIAVLTSGMTFLFFLRGVVACGRS